jgi:hypothetical protein
MTTGVSQSSLRVRMSVCARASRYRTISKQLNPHPFHDFISNLSSEFHAHTEAQTLNSTHQKAESIIRTCSVEHSTHARKRQHKHARTNRLKQAIARLRTSLSLGTNETENAKTACLLAMILTERAGKREKQRTISAQMTRTMVGDVSEQARATGVNKSRPALETTGKQQPLGVQNESAKELNGSDARAEKDEQEDAAAKGRSRIKDLTEAIGLYERGRRGRDCHCMICMEICVSDEFMRSFDGKVHARRQLAYRTLSVYARRQLAYRTLSVFLARRIRYVPCRSIQNMCVVG